MKARLLNKAVQYDELAARIDRAAEEAAAF
jgi:hypothetical protein